MMLTNYIKMPITTTWSFSFVGKYYTEAGTYCKNDNNVIINILNTCFSFPD